MRFIIIFLLPVFIFSYEWAPPQRVGNGMVGYSQFNLDCFDRLWCIFIGDSGVRASRYLDSLWSEPVLIYSGPAASCVGGFDATRAKKDGKLWVLVSEEGFPEYYNVLYYDGSIWSDTFILPTPGGCATGFRLAADSIGKVWTVFNRGEDYRIWCDICEDTTWTGPYVVCIYPTYDQVMGSYITIDPRGIRWAGATALFTSSGNQIFLCRSDSTGRWSDSLIMGPLLPRPQGGTSCDIIADNAGNIWIEWVDWNEEQIYTAYLDTNLNWSPYYQITQSTSGGWMVVDRENKVWIVYGKVDNLYYRVWNGIVWSPEDSILFPPVSFGDIFYDPIRNRIWVSFKTGGNDIYTTWTNPSSEIEEQGPTLDAKSLTSEIYPNPAKSVIRVHGPFSEKTIKIFDISGKIIREIATFPSLTRNDRVGEIKISLKGINPGIYFLRLGKQTKKFLVVR